ncbi:MAG: uncharacterized protein A8A55_2070 [Amphiamblys sp. WSBS2006]|nr:MAG: uncharacterized protein A8A55_2070 [Amphiamblys sp. WSBS2006]
MALCFLFLVAVFGGREYTSSGSSGSDLPSIVPSFLIGKQTPCFDGIIQNREAQVCAREEKAAGKDSSVGRKDVSWEVTVTHDETIDVFFQEKIGTRVFFGTGLKKWEFSLVGNADTPPSLYLKSASLYERKIFSMEVAVVVKDSKNDILLEKKEIKTKEDFERDGLCVDFCTAQGEHVKRVTFDNIARIELQIITTNHSRPYERTATHPSRPYGRETTPYSRPYGRETTPYSRLYERKISPYSHPYERAARHYSRPYEMYPQDSDVPVGITNLGFTCYMSSLLQILFSIPRFRETVFAIQQSEGKQECDQLICALGDLFGRLKKKEFAPTPGTLFELLKQKKIAGNGHQDPHELYFKLLNYILEHVKRGENEEKIKSLFSIEQSNKITCMDVDYTSETTEAFYNMSLVIENKRTVEESLEEYTKEGQLSGENKFDAEKHGMQDANKNVSFKKLPPVLMLTVQRYGQDGGNTKKLCDDYAFPEVLGMGKYLSRNSEHREPQKYVLVGVISHTGSLDYGHYVSFIRDPKRKKWFLFDDEVVRCVSSNEAVEGNYGSENNRRCGYMLAYVREADIEGVFYGEAFGKEQARQVRIFEDKKKQQTPVYKPHSKEKITVYLCYLNNQRKKSFGNYEKNTPISEILLAVQKRDNEIKSLWILNGRKIVFAVPEKKLCEVSKENKIYFVGSEVVFRYKENTIYCPFLLEIYLYDEREDPFLCRCQPRKDQLFGDVAKRCMKLYLGDNDIEVEGIYFDEKTRGRNIKNEPLGRIKIPKNADNMVFKIFLTTKREEVQNKPWKKWFFFK